MAKFVLFLVDRESIWERTMAKKRLVLLVLLVLTATLVGSIFTACNDASLYGNSTDANLLFFDDFDGELNTETWNVNHELRKGGYWDREQAFTKDGHLVLRTVQKEDGNYYMGAIDTMNKFETHFGYFEAKCILPKASGIWSAFWLMPRGMAEHHTTDVNVCGAEIDIMESPYYNPIVFDKVMPRDIDTYQCAVHVGDYDNNYLKKEAFVNTTTVAKNKYGKTHVKIYDNEWHTFGLHWTDKFYRFYYDRKLVYEITDSKVISTAVDDFLFLSVEIGGANGKASKPAFLFANGVDKNPDGTFPVDFLVDYVAVYDDLPFRPARTSIFSRK